MKSRTIFQFTNIFSNLLSFLIHELFLNSQIFLKFYVVGKKKRKNPQIVRSSVGWELAIGGVRQWAVPPHTLAIKVCRKPLDMYRTMSCLHTRALTHQRHYMGNARQKSPTNYMSIVGRSRAESSSWHLKRRVIAKAPASDRFGLLPGSPYVFLCFAVFRRAISFCFSISFNGT